MGLSGMNESNLKVMERRRNVYLDNLKEALARNNENQIMAITRVKNGGGQIIAIFSKIFIF